MLSSKILPSFKIGDAGISGTDITWQTVLVVGFVAGFLERLVPDLLKRTAATSIDKAATDKAAGDSVAADKPAADKGAADRAAADKGAADKGAANKTAADKAVGR